MAWYEGTLDHGDRLHTILTLCRCDHDIVSLIYSVHCLNFRAIATTKNVFLSIELSCKRKWGGKRKNKTQPVGIARDPRPESNTKTGCTRDKN